MLTDSKEDWTMASLMLRNDSEISSRADFVPPRLTRFERVRKIFHWRWPGVVRLAIIVGSSVASWGIIWWIVA